MCLFDVGKINRYFLFENHLFWGVANGKMFTPFRFETWHYASCRHLAWSELVVTSRQKRKKKKKTRKDKLLWSKQVQKNTTNDIMSIVSLSRNTHMSVSIAVSDQAELAWQHAWLAKLTNKFFVHRAVTFLITTDNNKWWSPSEPKKKKKKR